MGDSIAYLGLQNRFPSWLRWWLNYHFDLSNLLDYREHSRLPRKLWEYHPATEKCSRLLRDSTALEVLRCVLPEVKHHKYKVETVWVSSPFPVPSIWFRMRDQIFIPMPIPDPGSHTEVNGF